MIRYRAEPDARPPIVFLGLSDQNLTRLRAGLPIRIKASDPIGLGVEVVIYHGASEVDLTRELEELGVLPHGSAQEDAGGDRGAQGAAAAMSRPADKDRGPVLAFAIGDELVVLPPERPVDEFRDRLIAAAPEHAEVIRRRDAVADRVCERHGWDKNHLSMEQVLEIRQDPEWT